MNPTETFGALIDKLEGRAPTDRLMVMAQNPANNHHWSLGLGMVSAAELLAELTFARDVRTVLERRGFSLANPSHEEPSV